MCFSPTASFLASAGLAVVGIMSARGATAMTRPLVAIPFLFAVQQAIEGFQWLSIANGQPNILLSYGYLLFAYLLWPLIIPLILFAIEQKKRRRILPLVWIGAGVSLGFLFLLFTHPITVEKIAYSISYDMPGPLWMKIAGVLAYASATIGPFLISTVAPLRWFGLLLASSFILAYLAFTYAYLSVWCFLAAVLSGLVYVIVRNKILYK